MRYLSGNKRRREALIAVLAAAALTFLMVSLAQNQRVAALSLQINAAYQKSLYETTELMGGLQLNLEKLLVSSGSASEQKLLNGVARQAEGAADNLSILPDGDERLVSTIKFINQAGDIARVLGEKLAAGGAVEDEDRDRLLLLHGNAAKLNRELRDMLGELETGTLRFDLDDGQMRSVSRQLDEKSEPLVDYPVLLYDGPFSDAREDGTVRAMGEPVNGARAAEIAREFFGAQRVKSVTAVGESNILSECYEFELETESGLIYAGVTRAGGQILYALPASDVTGRTIPQAQGLDIAARFLSEKGYADMELSYWRQLNGILTANFCATQDGVLLYPDLIKLQVNMENGLIIGIEAGNYLRNHVPRALQTPLVTREQAVSALNAHLTAENARLALIPLDGREILCWEITAALPDDTKYLIYTDALTGQERTILQLLRDDEGILTQ